MPIFAMNSEGDVFMRYLNFLIILLLLNVALYAGIVEHNYHFSDLRIEQVNGYQTIRFPNTVLMGTPGAPLLPYRSVSLILPPGKIATKIEIIPSGEQTVAGSFKLLPAQYPRPISAPKNGAFTRNPEIYNSSTPYPANRLGKLKTYFMNGYGFALSLFTPVTFIPDQGVVRYYTDIKIRIYTKPDLRAQKAMELLRTCKSDLEKIKALAQNPPAVSAYPSAEVRSGEAYQLLVVTAPAFTEAFKALSYPYLIRGIKMKIVDTDSIYNAMPAATHKESIRNFIIQEYSNHNIKYVLLGGDVEWVPYCGFYCVVKSDQLYTDNDIPADLYYSALDGTWNDDGDDKWGEIGEDDLLPEVAVARMPFSTSDELQRMLHKVISYQDSPVTGELDRPLLAGEKLWDDPLTWGADYMDLLVGHHEDNGYITDGISPDDPYETLYDREMAPSQWSGDDIVQKINQGKSFVYHAGHANSTYVMRLYSSDITNETFPQVDGITHNYTLVNTQGCNCGAFDYDDCIAEEMVKIDNFAVGFVGNSRYGWFNEGTTEGPSTHLQREFVNAIYADKHFRIGQAHMYSKIKTAPYVNAPDQHEEGAMRWCFYDCNVLSDPVLGIWTEEPITVQADYPHTIQTNTTTIEVSVSSDNEPSAGLTCALVKDSLLFGVGITDSLGIATIHIDPPFSQTGTANIVVSGYNCLPTFFPLNIENPSDIALQRFVPENSELLGNYPNPFNASTVIEYILKSKSPVRVRLTVYNMLGQMVGMPLNAIQRAGRHKIIFRANDLPSGVYVYHLQINGNTLQNRKMLLIR